MYFQTGIEDFLVIVRAEKLKDGVLVLCDAFHKAQDKKVRDTIARVLRRSFKFTGIQEREDAGFVERCRRWYEDNRRDYEPNINYLGHLALHKFEYESNGILKPRKAIDRTNN